MYMFPLVSRSSCLNPEVTSVITQIKTLIFVITNINVKQFHRPIVYDIISTLDKNTTMQDIDLD